MPTKDHIIKRPFVSALVAEDRINLLQERIDVLEAALNDALLYVSHDNRRKAADILREQFERALGL